MSSESNYWGNIGAQNPNGTAADFKRGGASDSQASEAAAAAARARQSK